ncbi:ribonuclease D [Rheinheimera sp.]|uniref:ribonuclease D n=1 Tax=Rheinheimera sp. TaxID=1869214 RepID=UPI00307ED6D6
MSDQLISSQTELDDFCAQASKAACLALDTEFIRQSTLYPKLGLIQLFDGHRLALVDPLADLDWSSLRTLLVNPAVVKVIHSCTEDLEALATKNLIRIEPLFDTQLAAELVGWGSSLGYAKLVHKVTGKELDKSESRTDWLARPLSPLQLRYAAHDVEYLLPVYQQLLTELQQKNQLDLLLAEGRHLIERRHVSWPDAFKHLEVKNSFLLNPRELAVLRELVVWRQQYAEQKDMALGLIFKDFHLLDIAKRRPGSIESMLNIPEIPQREVRRHGKTVLMLIEKAKALPAEQCPHTFYHRDVFGGQKEEQQKLLDAIKQAARQAGIPSELLAVRKQVNELFNWIWRISDDERSVVPVPELLRNWRLPLLKPYLPAVAHIQWP